MISTRDGSRRREKSSASSASLYAGATGMREPGASVPCFSGGAFCVGLPLELAATEFEPPAGQAPASEIRSVAATSHLASQRCLAPISCG